MSYATTNPPVCIVPALGTHAAVWVYKSADAHTAVDASGYFTDGANLGLKANDLMFVLDTSTPTATMHIASSATTVTVATLS